MRALEREISKDLPQGGQDLVAQKRSGKMVVNAKNLDKFIGGVLLQLRHGREGEPGRPSDGAGMDRSWRRIADHRMRRHSRQGNIILRTGSLGDG